MSPSDGSLTPPPGKAGAPATTDAPVGETPAAAAPAAPSAPVPVSPSAGRFAELLAGMAPLERIERLAVIETLCYGTVYEGRVFRASRAEPVSLLALDPALEANSSYPPILRNLLGAARLSGAHLLAPRGLYRDEDDLYALYDAQPGLSLATGFDYLQRNGLRLSAEAVLRIASGVLQALDELEREDATAGAGAAGRLRCHGLLIPENLYVTDDQRLLVRGIGIWQSEIAKMGRLGPKERRYLAPLQTSSGTPSPRSDLISLGAILFEAAAGFPAFDSPPTEDDLAEIILRIDEIGAKAEDSRRDLFGIAHACLSAMAVTPASRNRMRTTVDTMFLREAARERIQGCISLEDLAGRVKAARPAIVKAVALDLDPVEVPSGKPAPLPLPPPPAVTAAGTPSAGPAVPSVAAPPPEWTAPAVSPAILPAPARRFEVHLSQTSAVWLLVGVTAVVLAFAIFWLSRPTPAPQPEEDFSVRRAPLAQLAVAPTSPPLEAQPAETTSPAPAATPDAAALAALEAAGQREAALAQPTPAPTAPPARPTESPRRSRPTPVSRRAERRETRGGAATRGAASSRPAAAAGAPQAAAPPPEDSSLPAVAPGTLVALGTPGLVPPLVTERPEDPHFLPSDPRPATPGSVQLQVLVDEKGRVLDHRILGASRFPPGVATGVATYLGRLRFKPAELRGVPVKVWIRHDMRFLAPP